MANDYQARTRAILEHDRTFLVEAGAGTGKTSVMSSRVAMMMANGIPPESIVAITFTEVAAGELMERIRQYAGSLSGLESADGKPVIPEVMKFAVSSLTDEQVNNIRNAYGRIDEMTCTTIHGFCNKIIKTYPAKSEIDPGATALKGGFSDDVFSQMVEDWLLEEMTEDKDGSREILKRLVLDNPEWVIGIIKSIAARIHENGGVSAPASLSISDALDEFRDAVGSLSEFRERNSVLEETTARFIVAFENLLANDIDMALQDRSEIDLIDLLAMEKDLVLFTTTGTPRSQKNKTKWTNFAANAGMTKDEALNLYDESQTLYNACHETYGDLVNAIVCRALQDLIQKASEVMARYADDKRRRACVDFDDMISHARKMLLNHDDVRRNLGERFRHVLVDEFQDTDSVQNEILWLLCGDRKDDDPADAPWTDYRIRDGALFLVGDPKQAIYRFRGADIHAYSKAKGLLEAQDAGSTLIINTNYRSKQGVLDYVNAKFDERLNADGQPGFIELVPHRTEDDADLKSVYSLNYDIMKRFETDKRDLSSADQRTSEAEKVAEICHNLLNGFEIDDPRDGRRPCRPGDIALLSPTGSDLYLYELELEKMGIPISPRVGYSYYMRQEVQDMITLTRILSNAEDVLALGAFLRGPLVGLTDSELLDIAVENGKGGYLKFPSIMSDLKQVSDSEAGKIAKKVIGKLRDLHALRHRMTPYALLSKAVNDLQLRPILRLRHENSIDRVLANVDQYLEFSQDYGVRGLDDFAKLMTDKWEDKQRVVEGYPDVEQDAVSINSIHAAKGLEWPIVIPINTVTRIQPAVSARRQDTVVDKETGILYTKVLRQAPAGYEAAVKFETNELELEHVRLFYVAFTRARDYLLLPQPRGVEGYRGGTWAKLIDFHDSELPDFEQAPEYKLAVDQAGSFIPPVGDAIVNEENKEDFARDRDEIQQMQKSLERRNPSRIEVERGEDEPETEAPVTAKYKPVNRNGLERGKILHKLMEEVILGMIDVNEIEQTAKEFIEQRDEEPSDDPAQGLSPAEMADAVRRTLELDETASLLKYLHTEYPVYSMDEENGRDIAWNGIIDAVAVDDYGKPFAVIDWKSNSYLDPKTEAEHAAQVKRYMKMIDVPVGYVIMMTTDEVKKIEE